MNPLFERREREKLERVDAALAQAAPDWRRTPSPDLRARILAKIDAAPLPERSERLEAYSAARTAWLALAAALLIAWLAWQAAVPPRSSVERTVVHVSVESLVRRAWEQLSAPSIARSLDQPLLVEVGHMRADARRAVDFLVARVSLPVGTRAPGD